MRDPSTRGAARAQPQSRSRGSDAPQHPLPGFEDPVSSSPEGPSQNRILGLAVPAFFPQHDARIHSMIYGEAPGPRGADKSGIPFWGDRAGLPLYRSLAAAECARIPEEAWSDWDGLRLHREGLRPVLEGVSLSNAFPLCPSSDGLRFRAPTRSELQSTENLERLRGELAEGLRRGASRVVTLGKCAGDTLGPLAAEAGLEWVRLVHPSAQGLLSEAPGRGRGLRLSDLQAAWEKHLTYLLQTHH